MMNQASFALLFVVAVATIATIPTEVNGTLISNWFPSQSTNASHNLIVGTRVPRDRLLSTQNVSKSALLLLIVKQAVSFRTTNYETITQVRILDQMTNGRGAYPSIASGGPGNRAVTVQLTSQRGRGINFVIEIYGQ